MKKINEIRLTLTRKGPKGSVTFEDERGGCETIMLPNAVQDAFLTALNNIRVTYDLGGYDLLDAFTVEHARKLLIADEVDIVKLDKNDDCPGCPVCEPGGKKSEGVHAPVDPITGEKLH